MFLFFTLISFVTTLVAVPVTDRSGDCVGAISSLDDVSNAIQCTTVNINAFTVPAGKTFELKLLDSTTVNVLGEIQFGNKSWAGPLFEVKGNDITFNGNNQIWDGGGPFYWDGQGSNGGVTKPRPMMRIEMSGTFKNVELRNTPAHAISVTNPGPLTVSSVIIDDSQGNEPNSQSNGQPAGANTDGFDVSGSNLLIENCKVYNQDDCLAINKGTNITFDNNYCEGGHGISVGSIASNVKVSDVTVSRNTVIDSLYSFRIKTKKSASGSSVDGVTYTGNIASGSKKFGVLITQSYPDDFGTPGNDVTISNVNFGPDTTTITCASSAYDTAVNCGTGSCTGIWDWSGLKTSGGKVGPSVNSNAISGFNG